MGLFFLLVFGAAFSFIYFRELPVNEKEKGFVKKNESSAQQPAPHESVKQREEVRPAVTLQMQETTGLTKTPFVVKTKTALAPKEIIAPPQSVYEKRAVTAHKQKTKERGSRIATHKEKESLISKTGKIVIIIDDLGNNMKVANELLDMNKDITFSVLPKLKYSKEIADAVFSKNKEVLLHLPMEPENHKNKPGPGAITDGMSAEEIQKQVKEDMESVPNIVGMNNHMGSKATSSKKVMESVLSAVKDEGLFYVDSVTSSKSKGHDTAQKMNLPTAKRDVFLDGVQNKNYVKSQIKKLKNLAKKNGIAVGIGHPHKETVDALREMLPELEKEGIQIVPASEVVK